MNVYILTYKGGACGTFINYFINRHKSFPNQICIGECIKGNLNQLVDDDVHFHRISRHQLSDYAYISDNYEEIVKNKRLAGLDLKKLDDIWRRRSGPGHDHGICVTYGGIDAWRKSRICHDHRDIFLNMEFDSISLTPSPAHHPAFFVYHPNYIVGSDSNNIYKHISILTNSKFRRIKNADKYPQAFDLKQTTFNKELRKAMNVPLHTIHLLNLLDCDTNEYNKLLDFIEQPPLDNWKELITDYRTAIKY